MLTTAFCHFSDSVQIVDNVSVTAYKSGNSIMLQFSCCAYGSPAPIMAWSVTSHKVLNNNTHTTGGHLSTCLQVNATLENATARKNVSIICAGELPYKMCSRPGEQYCRNHINFAATSSVSAVVLGKGVNLDMTHAYNTHPCWEGRFVQQFGHPNRLICGWWQTWVSAPLYTFEQKHRILLQLC